MEVVGLVSNIQTEIKTSKRKRKIKRGTMG
jgi:hypothetical protein